MNFPEGCRLECQDQFNTEMSTPGCLSDVCHLPYQIFFYQISLSDILGPHNHIWCADLQSLSAFPIYAATYLPAEWISPLGKKNDMVLMVLPSAIIKISNFLPVHPCEHKINKNENNQDYFFLIFL